MSTNKDNTYFKRPDTWHYQGNKDVIQMERVISLKRDDIVAGKRFRSIKTKYIYDCNHENTYATMPAGFFADKYATGEPIVPYPFSASRWLIAKADSSEAMFWKIYCVQLKATIDAQL